MPACIRTVGAQNYKYFVMLLCYTSVGGLYNACCAYIWLSWRQIPARVPTDAFHDNDKVVVLCNAAVIGIVAAILAPFAALHCYFSARNLTTIEALRGADAAVYSDGWRSNLKQVFGRTWWAWALPLDVDHGVEDMRMLIDV
jgi:hypothetical protein